MHTKKLKEQLYVVPFLFLCVFNCLFARFS